jgi:hypothetical protein
MKSKISKILGIGLTAGLVLGLIGAVFAAPVSADMMKWSKVSTPSRQDLVILPENDILDYDIGGDGDTIYAVLEVNDECNSCMYVGEDDGNGGDDSGWALVKSTDGGVTWSDISAKVAAATNLPNTGDGDTFGILVCVAVAPDDEDWVAVAGYDDDTGDPMVVASKDGGSNFTYTGNMTDTTTTGDGTQLDTIFDMAVSIEVDSIHNIAVAGESNATGPDGTVYRLQAGSWLSAAWVDTTDYLGWDNGVTNGSDAVVAVAFSPNFDIDDTIVCMTVDDYIQWDVGQPFVQSGIWEGSGGSWNASAGFPNAIKVTSDGDTLVTGAFMRSMGFALPADYDGSDSGARAVFLYVDAWNATTGLIGGWVFRLDNNSLSAVVGPPGDPVLASIAVNGDADTGKVMIGEYFKFANDGGWDGSGSPPFDGWGPESYSCCEGVRVWHTQELDFCCPQWEGACKDPSGFYMALVMYTPDGEKEYASTSGSIDEDFEDASLGDYNSWVDWFGILSYDYDTGTPGDESAFSVSRDDAVSFNQIGLIDTDIDYLSDFVACPDCGTYYLSTINDNNVPGPNDDPCLDMYCHCDSVWRSYDAGDTWERIFHGDWSDNIADRLLLRIPCDAIEDCCDQDAVAPSGTIYLGIQDSDADADDDIFYSRDCGQCWNDPPSPKVDLQDFTVESENTVYVIDGLGMITKSTQYGRRWSDPADTGIDSSHMVLACCDEGFVVVTPQTGSEKVAWTDDGGDTWNLTDALPGDGSDAGVHVACDPVCENIIYVATDSSGPQGAIYRTDLTDGSWTEISVVNTNYTGILVAREGTLYAGSDRLNFVTDTTYCMDRKPVDADTGTMVYSGVARNLTPCETACCGQEDWDYLICGLDPTPSGGDGQDFDAQTNSIDLCGCLSVATNTKIFAIDRNATYNEFYDLCDYSDGALWVYEDCAAKLGPTLTSPADGSVLDCEPCAGCDAANFTLKWERMCEACSYDIEIMDETGNVVVSWTDKDITGDPPSLFVDGTMDDSGYYYLECGMTYTWHVREANTSCECVHSPWSETWTFTIAVGAADAIQLLAPTKGAMDVPIQNIGFSWTSVRNASSYSFVLSPNANLTGALVSQDMSTTAFNYVGPLDYSKAYYWQIIAWEDGTRLTTSSIGVFNTMAEPVEPTPPVVVEQQPAPVINIPAAQKITPTWIYAIIGIGAALAVVVIVLIVRTRRP